MKTVYCPVKCGQVDGGECIVISDVAHHMIKPSVLPDGIEWSEEQRQRCLTCKWNYENYPQEEE